MRLTAVLLAPLLLFYLGGMYRAESFVLAAASIWAGIPVLHLLARLSGRGLKTEIALPKAAVRRGEAFACTIRIENRSLLPITKCAVRVRLCMQGELLLEKTVGGCLPGRGSVRLDLPVTPRNCGCLTVEVERIYIYDLLALTRFAKRGGDSGEAVILPAALVLPVALTEAPLMPADEDGAPGSQNGPPPEVREIDSYRPGDAMRDVHWKLSARQDALLSKRYSLETRPRFSVWWDGSGTEKLTPARADAFWSLCLAVSAGLLDAEAEHDVCMYDFEKEEIAVRRIRDMGDLLQLLAGRIGGAGVFSAGALPEGAQRERFRREGAGERVLTLDASLRLSLGRSGAIQFHEDSYAEEIGKKRIAL